jgi:hypothetical protein
MEGVKAKLRYMFPRCAIRLRPWKQASDIHYSRGRAGIISCKPVAGASDWAGGWIVQQPRRLFHGPNIRAQRFGFLIPCCVLRCNSGSTSHFSTMAFRTQRFRPFVCGTANSASLQSRYGHAAISSGLLFWTGWNDAVKTVCRLSRALP